MNRTGPTAESDSPAPLRPRTEPRFGRLRHGSTPARIRVLAVAAVVAGIGLAATMSMTALGVRGSLATIGDRTGPTVIATSQLYFALSDMDAQVANVLLVADATDLGINRHQAVNLYEHDRAIADSALLAASTVTLTGNGRVAALLDDLGRYEALASEAMLEEAGPRVQSGHPPAAALDAYRQATDLMHTRLLPVARQLTDANAGVLVDRYRSARAGLADDVVATIAFGAAATVILVGLQEFLRRRTRRLLNPALLVATALTVGLTVTGVSLGQGEREHLRSLKQDSFDSVLALTQARAVSYDANADESRYLLDPVRAGVYQDAFFSKTQELLTLPDASLSWYDAALAGALDAYHARHTDIRFTGFFGTEMRNITFSGERDAAEATLTRFQTYERDDREIRAQYAAGDLAGAIRFCTSYAPGDSNWAFDQYDQALAHLIQINTDAFGTITHAGQHEDRGWEWIPGAAEALVIALVVGGIWSRLAEYR